MDQDIDTCSSKIIPTIVLVPNVNPTLLNPNYELFNSSRTKMTATDSLKMISESDKLSIKLLQKFLSRVLR